MARTKPLVAYNSSFSSVRAWRRMRSMALCRAVWMIQARGNSGTPEVRPLVHGGRKGFLRRLFRQVEVADQPDQGGDDPAPIGAIDRSSTAVVESAIIFDCKYFSAGVSIWTPAVRLTVGGTQMKYMLLIYMDEQAMNDAEREHCYVESTELAHELKSNGQFLATAPLQPVSTATSVQVRDGKRLVTDGPFAETREQLGGYFLVDAKNLDEAIGIAGRIPGARVGTVEIRPVIEIPDLPKEKLT